ncbi:MAG: phosphoesterase [Gammaproteobacteria bacterium]|nr:phosphoesterase [Gammaproteobacteria bacterium]
MKFSLRLAALVCGWMSLSSTAALAGSAAPAHGAAPPIRHVFLIVLENEPFHATFGPGSAAPYLARTLPRRGALLTQYYGVGHFSLDNYLAIVSGQAPNPDTQQDCPIYRDFVATGPVGAYGQLPGRGCVYPASVKTIADQLEAAGFSWKGYMEDMGRDPARERSTCGHAVLGSRDPTETATRTDEYAAKHDPFVYFHSIIDDAARCDAHVVNLDRLRSDLRRAATTPNFAFITPSLCHDGHNSRCADGKPGGLQAIDRFLKVWVPRITRSPAFRKDGLLVITFDEGSSGEACCGERRLPGGPVPGQFGPGGGRVGAVLLSPFIHPGTVSAMRYDHYALLRSIEGYFGLPALGYAGAPGVRVFGSDVF